MTPPPLTLIDHWFDLPHDYAAPDVTLKVYAREVISAIHPITSHAAMPMLIYLEGGPGFGAPRPVEATGWLGEAVKTHRVLLLDQRGTGRSSPVTAEALARFDSPAAQAQWLAQFRADNIVRDCEAIRAALIGDRPWSVLGQSYGGFCALSYLSAAPQGLECVMITGGMPPLTATADEIYRATYPRVQAKNAAYFLRYPEDRARADAVVRVLREQATPCPDGGVLTVERFLQLGLCLGMSDGAASLHYLLETAFAGGPGGERLSWNFLRACEHAMPFDTNPIFALLHESVYAQGCATQWSASRLRSDFAAFDPAATSPLFSGEMIYPSMFDDYVTLRPLKAAAELLAAKSDWPMLYDMDVLADNRVPVAAAVYFDDMYVHRQFSEATAAHVPNVSLWVTNEYEHNGLRADGARILQRLRTMTLGLA